jgi:hypothetical protein
MAQCLYKLSFRNKIIDNFEDLRLLFFSYRICPLFGNILRQGIEVTGTGNLIFTTE